MSVDFYVGKKIEDNERVFITMMQPPDFDPKLIVGYYDDDLPNPQEPMYAHNPWVMNCSNTNGAHLLSLLGYDTEELCGTLDPAEVLDRIAHAIAMVRSMPGIGSRETVEKVLSPEIVIESMIHHNVFTSRNLPEVPEGEGIRVTFCGVDDDYTVRRLTELKELVEIAIREGGVLAYA